MDRWMRDASEAGNVCMQARFFFKHCLKKNVVDKPFNFLKKVCLCSLHVSFQIYVMWTDIHQEFFYSCLAVY